MKSVTIGEKHMFKDFGIILASKIISPPEPQINLLEVPLRDGSIDLTETLTDEVKYKDRNITLTFRVIEREKWAVKISEIQNYLHGKRLKIVFDDDLAFYYIGRVSVNEWTSDKNIGTLVLECIVEPFKYEMFSSAEKWEWDIFDFEQSVINETILEVSGELTYSLICTKKRIFPTFGVDAPMTVTFDGITHNLVIGRKKLYDLFLHEGINEMTFKGNGNVIIDYRGGSL